MAESSALVVVQVLGMTFGLEDNMLAGQAQVQIIRCATCGFFFTSTIWYFSHNVRLCISQETAKSHVGSKQQ